MTTIITGTNGPLYQFSAVPSTFGPWNQLIHVDTAPYHVHMGHTMYYMKNHPYFFGHTRPPIYRFPRRVY